MTKPVGAAQFVVFLLTFLIAACQGSDPKEPIIAAKEVAREPVAGTLSKPGIHVVVPADHDEKNVLYPGQSLWAGGYGLVLESGQTGFGARLTENGEFILYNSSGRLWTARTKAAAPGYELILQNDGNLVLYNDRFQPIWASETHAYFGGEKYRTADWKPTKLVLEPNLLVLYSVTGRRVWSHQTGEIGNSK